MKVTHTVRDVLVRLKNEEITLDEATIDIEAAVEVLYSNIATLTEMIRVSDEENENVS
jgi:hypothetical protein